MNSAGDVVREIGNLWCVRCSDSVPHIIHQFFIDSMSSEKDIALSTSPTYVKTRNAVAVFVVRCRSCHTINGGTKDGVWTEAVYE